LNFSENGSKDLKAIVDTNVIYSVLYNPRGTCGRIVLMGVRREIQLFSTDIVKEELFLNLKRNLGMTNGEASKVISSLPVEWVPKELYSDKIEEALSLIAHKSDAPTLALALAIRSPIISGDRHFQTRKVRKKARIFTPQQFLKK